LFLSRAGAIGSRLRGGLTFVPIGRVNQRHAPPMFQGVQRAE
jgi:hypothetical protein